MYTAQSLWLMEEIERKVMPKGIKGYRWVETGIRVWQLEHPSGTRRFCGCVSENSSGWTWWTRNREQGEANSIRGAKDQVETRVIPTARASSAPGTALA
jgi:hypothetical protein